MFKYVCLIGVLNIIALERQWKLVRNCIYTYNIHLKHNQSVFLCIYAIGHTFCVKYCFEQNDVQHDNIVGRYKPTYAYSGIPRARNTYNKYNNNDNTARHARIGSSDSINKSWRNREGFEFNKSGVPSAQAGKCHG